MAKEMQELDLLAAQEEVNLQRQRVGLDVGEARGQQMMAADARAAAAAATQAGVQGLVDMGTTLFQICKSIIDLCLIVLQDINQLLIYKFTNYLVDF